MKKKVVCALLAVTSSLCLANAALAKDTTAQFVTVRTIAGAPEAKGPTKYLTDIVITNYSSHSIIAQVPYYDQTISVDAGYAQHIHGYDSDYKRVVLSDYRGTVFYNFVTPNYYPIDVYDNDGKTVVKSK